MVISEWVIEGKGARITEGVDVGAAASRMYWTFSLVKSGILGKSFSASLREGSNGGRRVEEVIVTA
jgi:hypothetical protein